MSMVDSHTVCWHNDRALLLTELSVITQLLPFVGYPRTLNALMVINKVIPVERDYRPNQRGWVLVRPNSTQLKGLVACRFQSDRREVDGPPVCRHPLCSLPVVGSPL